MVINDFVREVLSLNCFGIVSSVGKNQVSEFSRVFGYDFNEGTGVLTVFIYKPSADKLLQCFNQTKKVACVISDPLSHKTIQMKGEYISSADASQQEVDLINNKFQPRVAEVFQAFGMPSSFKENWKFHPTLTMKMQCKEIFDQTPKINTGIKIS